MSFQGPTLLVRLIIRFRLIIRVNRLLHLTPRRRHRVAYRGTHHSKLCEIPWFQNFRHEDLLDNDFKRDARDGFRNALEFLNVIFPYFKLLRSGISWARPRAPLTALLARPFQNLEVSARSCRRTRLLNP